jgi:hypothetical protein
MQARRTRKSGSSDFLVKALGSGSGRLRRAQASSSSGAGASASASASAKSRTGSLKAGERLEGLFIMELGQLASMQVALTSENNATETVLGDV